MSFELTSSRERLIEDEAEVQAQALMDQFKKDNPNAKK